MAVFRGIELVGLELSGPRLTLRPWGPADAEDVHTIMRDRTMWEYLALPDPYTIATARTFVGEFGAAGRAAGTSLDCAVVERETGTLVGSASLRLAEAALHGAEIGYWVARAARGRGYAAEATRILRDWGFSVGVERLRVLCDVRNLASVRVAMAAGFRFEGIGRGPLPGPDTPLHDLGHADLARFGLLVTDPRTPVPPAFAPLPDGGLDDGVVRLRVMTGEDAPARHEMMTDPVSLGWEFSATAPSAETSVRTAQDAGLLALVGPHLRLTVVDAATGAFAGELTVRRGGPPQLGSLGYAVHPAFRGRGYTTRALRLITAWAFDVADLARLELGAKVGNVASQRAAQHAGFVAQGVLACRLRNPDGTFSDEAIFGLVNPRYAGSASRINP